MLTVLQPGLLTTVQDLGRHGSAHLGIGASGAADQPALRLANALVGNPATAGALEMTLIGPTLQFERDAWVALTGAPLPRARLNDAPVAMWRAVRVTAGARLSLGPMPCGCRSYLAVAGGIDVDTWRDSRATDVNVGLGPIPRPLKAADTLPVGEATGDAIVDASWSLDPRPWFDAAQPHMLRITPGSHTDRLDARSRAALAAATFVASNASNRVGVRLDGPPLALGAPLELVSAGVTAGTVQLPPGGHPIIMGPEHPVTGGYPRIAHVVAVDLPKLAQCRPGDTVRFAWMDMAEAVAALARREVALHQLIERIHRRRDKA